jgi:hexosaminidase
MTYSPSQVKDLIAYAAARGIDILPEFDTPGHTSAIWESHPEHIACAPGTTGYDGTIANEPPSGQLRFAVPATQSFAVDVLQSFSSLFTSKMFSTGGDELNAKCYQNDAQTQAALSSSGKTIEQALSDFTVAEHNALAKQGKTPIVWEEMVLVHNITLSNNTVIM